MNVAHQFHNVSAIRAKNNVNLVRNFYFKKSRQMWSCVPIVSMDDYKTIERHRMIKRFNKNTKKYPSTMNNNYMMYTSDIDTGNLIKDVDKFRPKMVCFDTANGYTKDFHTEIRDFHRNYPDITICAGNVMTIDMVKFYIQECGVDVIKIGNSDDMKCPHPLRSLTECVNAAHSLGAYVMSDENIQNPSDVAKYFAVGADFVTFRNTDVTLDNVKEILRMVCSYMNVGHIEQLPSAVELTMKNSLKIYDR